MISIVRPRHRFSFLLLHPRNRRHHLRRLPSLPIDSNSPHPMNHPPSPGAFRSHRCSAPASGLRDLVRLTTRCRTCDAHRAGQTKHRKDSTLADKEPPDHPTRLLIGNHLTCRRTNETVSPGAIRMIASIVRSIQGHSGAQTGRFLLLQRQE